LSLISLLGIQAEWLDDDRLGAMLEGLAEEWGTLWSDILRSAVQEYAIDLPRLHGDTTSIYFEGVYTEKNGTPKGGGKDGPHLVRGYNKDGKWRKRQMVLSLITCDRLVVWFTPWDGNQHDEGVYLPDLLGLRATGLVPATARLVGDRKLATTENLIALCRLGQPFVAAHPWTEPAKTLWKETAARLAAGELTWQTAGYTPQREAGKAPEERSKYRVVEVGRKLADAERHTHYPLRMVGVWSSSHAARDQLLRERALAAGEAALTRIAGRLGKYEYKRRGVIESRLEKALGQAHARAYYQYTLTGCEEQQNWQLTWAVRSEALAAAAPFEGISLLVTNEPGEQLPTEDVLVAYKGQCAVEQTIDFLKSPVQIRPLWLHKPKRLVGLTLLIMIAVLVAGLLEQAVRQWIAQTGERVTGLMPEGRDTPRPTAKKLLQAFLDYTLVVVRPPEGPAVVHYPKLRAVQQQIWEIMKLPPLPASTLAGR
jgi:transposase